MKRLLFLIIIALHIHMEATPRVSIITSIWNGDDFIEGFMEDITKQTIFENCELILINAASPGNEETIIQKYLDCFPNIIYHRLEEDPGVYGVWNLAIEMASSEFIMNANIDDRSRRDAIEVLASALEAHTDVDLVYSGYLVTNIANETFQNNNPISYVDPPEFSPKLIYLCLPGPRPMWRKSMHEKSGLFDASFYSSGDQEMWCRAVSQGSKFKKVPEYTTLYFLNPTGVSTDPNPTKDSKRNRENAFIVKEYGFLWQ